MSRVAVVVLNYNGRRLLPDCLASLRALATPAEVVVADNGSTDGSLDYLRQAQPDARIIDLGHNLGFAAGYNRALAGVDAEWFVLLNNDAALAPDWLELLLDAACQHPRAAILGGKLLLGDPAQPGQPGQRRTLQAAGASLTEAGTAFEIGWGQPDDGRFDRPGPVGAIPGAALLVRREIYFELGGFEPDYFAYLEDVDLCWRAWLRGYEVHYVPAARAFHAYGASGGGRTSPFRIHWMQRNRLANMVKHLEPASLPRAVTVSVAYDLYRVLEFGRRAHWQSLRALGTGTLAFWRCFGMIVARRRTGQRARRMSDQELRARGLLVPTLAAFREYRRLGQQPRPEPALMRSQS